MSEGTYEISSEQLNILENISVVTANTSVVSKQILESEPEISQTLRKLSHGPFVEPAQPRPEELPRVLKKLDKLGFSDLKLREKFVLIAVCTDRKVFNDAQWSQIKKGLDDCFFGDQKDIGRFFGVGEVKLTKVRLRLYQRLLGCYVSNFSEDSARIKYIGQLLDRLVNKLPEIDSPWLECIKDKSFNFFRPSGLVLRLANRCENRRYSSVTAGIEDSGLFDLSQSLCLKVIVQLCERNRLQIVEGVGLWSYLSERVFRYSLPEVQDELRDLLFPVMSAFDQQELKETVSQTLIKDKLLEWFGDPRLKSGGHKNWLNLAGDADNTKLEFCRTTLVRWLTRDTLNLFFDAIENHYSQPDAPEVELRHFGPRRKFWTRYLNEQHISGAWVILGRAIERSALRNLRKDYGESIENAYATFNSANQAVLLLHIGNTIVVEWANSGAVWFCSKDWEAAPRLFGDYYDHGDLRATRRIESGGEDEIERITHRADWQEKIDIYFRRHENIRIRY